MTDYIRITPEGHIRTTSSALYDYIVSYVPFPTINKMVGDPIVLPNTVTVTRKSGLIETLIVKWEPVSTGVAGTFSISGGVDNSVYVVTQTVIVTELTDLDILRQIRDANPTSQLPLLWLDSEDPYTQWEGVTWSNGRAQQLFINNLNILLVTNINKLSELTQIDLRNNAIKSIDLSGLKKVTQAVLHNNSDLNYINLNDTVINALTCFNGKLKILDAYNAVISSIDAHNNLLESILIPTSGLTYIDVAINKLTAIPTLTSKGLISYYDFRYNNFPTSELDRFRAMLFNDESKLLPQNI